jgi:hypothetical protein
MTTLTAKLQGMKEVKEMKEREVPQTGYGRARYTIDYFMNGRPLKTNHDNAFMTVKDLVADDK